jgi:hypothetical protein
VLPEGENARCDEQYSFLAVGVYAYLSICIDVLVTSLECYPCEMECGQCDAFEFAIKTASARYAALLRVRKFQKLGPEVMSERRDYKMAKEAFRIHLEGHPPEALKRSG